jgi:mRNA interferase MazF
VIFNPFDVVVVPFPFTDRDASKRRPALVLSGEDFNHSHAQVVLGMITSSMQSPWPSDTMLNEWQEAGLSVPCKLRFKIFTLEQSLVLRKAGALTDKDAKAVHIGLSSLLGTKFNKPIK